MDWSRVRAALEEMGLYDDAAFARYAADETNFNFLSFDRSLQNLVANADLPSIWLPDTLDTYLRESDGSIIDFSRNVERVTGTRPSVTLSSGTKKKPRGIHVDIGGINAVIAGQSRREAYQLLCAWAARRGGARRFCLDESWRAWLVDEAQMAAIRRLAPFLVRAVDPEHPGAPVDSVRAARRSLDDLGIRIDLDADTLGWNMLEAGPGGMLAQLLAAARTGVPLRIDDLDIARDVFFECALQDLFTDLGKLNHPRVPVSLTLFDEAADGSGVEVSYSLGDAHHSISLPYERGHDAHPLVDVGVVLDHLNAALRDASSPYRLVAFEARLAAALPQVRVLVVPADRVAALRRAGALLFGTPDCDAPGPCDPFAPERFVSVGVADVVPLERMFVGDAECVDAASDYQTVIQELCGITSGELTLEQFECEENGGRRKLLAKIRGVLCTAELEGDTDWVDAAPLIASLNKVVTKLKLKRRFYECREPSWGQELGVVFATRAEANELNKEGLLVK